MLRFVHLELTPEQSMARVAQRSHHYFQPALVESQFKTLEKPVDEPGVLSVDGTLSIENLQEKVCDWIRSTP